MKPKTQEWVTKADGDFGSAGRERRARKQPNYDLACFCAQQCAEKYLKAVLQETGHRIPRTHHLDELLDLVRKSYPEVELLRTQLESLNAFAVQFRYPGAFATKEVAKKAYTDCSLVREALRRALKLPNDMRRAKRKKRSARRR